MVAHRHSYFWIIFVSNDSGMGSVSFEMVRHNNNGTNVIDWFWQSDGTIFSSRGNMCRQDCWWNCTHASMESCS